MRAFSGGSALPGEMPPTFFASTLRGAAFLDVEFTPPGARSAAASATHYAYDEGRDCHILAVPGVQGQDTTRHCRAEAMPMMPKCRDFLLDASRLFRVDADTLMGAHFAPR